MQEAQVFIVDLGSQYTQVIQRTIQDLGVKSVILSPKEAEAWLQGYTPKSIILSGGPASVYDNGAPSPPESILGKGVPILGICYGMQWLAHRLGGTVAAVGSHSEYGAAQIQITWHMHPLFTGVSGVRGIRTVWASHGDTVEVLPDGFKVLAVQRGTNICAAMGNSARNIWGVQFHPEVEETPCGKEILRNFLFGICECEEDQESWDIVESIREEVLGATKGKKVVGGYSGGVDSSFLLATLAPVLQERLLAVCIDAGQFREGEIEEIQRHAEVIGVELRIIFAADRLQDMLGDTVDAQEKRSIFQTLYGTILEQIAKEFGAEFLLQGSLAPDFIESGAVGNSALIKTHHNVGLNVNLTELHPLQNLFKHQVRSSARVLGLPPSISERQPFPGPGLLIRVIGAPSTPERLEVVRWADNEVTIILKDAGVYSEISQLVVALACLPTVGVKGDARVYESSILVHAVQTRDFMTASGHQISPECRQLITRKIVEHEKIVRVWFDETDKPPSTIEFL